MKITVDDSQVFPWAEIAKECAASYGWTWYEIDGDKIHFKVGDDVDGVVDPSGFATDFETGEDIEDWNVDWNEMFDGWANYVWAEDEDGNTVMIHD